MNRSGTHHELDSRDGFHANTKRDSRRCGGRRRSDRRADPRCPRGCRIGCGRSRRRAGIGRDARGREHSRRRPRTAAAASGRRPRRGRRVRRRDAQARSSELTRPRLRARRQRLHRGRRARRIDHCRALGSNSGGQIVGAYLDARKRVHGFLREGRRLRRIDFPGAKGTFASGIDDRGRVVGSYTEDATYSPCSGPSTASCSTGAAGSGGSTCPARRDPAGGDQQPRPDRRRVHRPGRQIARLPSGPRRLGHHHRRARGGHDRGLRCRRSGSGRGRLRRSPADDDQRLRARPRRTLHDHRPPRRRLLRHPTRRHQQRRPDRGHLSRRQRQTHGFVLDDGVYTTVDTPDAPGNTQVSSTSTTAAGWSASPGSSPMATSPTGPGS